MKPIEFKEANCIMKGPNGSGIGDLPVFRNEEVCVSKFQLDEKDLEELKRNGNCIYLSIMAGGKQPPVAVSVESMFIEGEE